MRIRHKPWARPELAACPFFIDDPATLKGQWHKAFAHPDRPFHIELGCGKGGFISQMAILHPETNFLAIDIKSEMLGLAKRNVEKAFAEAGREVDNVLLCAFDIERLQLILNENDCARRIYINFCNPWPKTKHHKKRLTHTRQLQNYKTFLTKDSELWFKTDSEDLFLATKRYLDEAGGFEITFLTDDLHASDFTESPATEHERMFTEQGLPTHFLIARYTGEGALQDNSIT